MIDWFAQTAFSGSLLLAVPVAMIAGLVSFFSPCVVPLLPGYVSYVTGLSAADLADSDRRGMRGRLLLGSFGFVLGFSVIFVSYGTLFGAIGLELMAYQRTISIVMGIVLAASGAVDASGELTASHFRLVYGVDIVRAVLMGAVILLGAFFVHSTAKKKLSA